MRGNGGDDRGQPIETEDPTETPRERTTLGLRIFAREFSSHLIRFHPVSPGGAGPSGRSETGRTGRDEMGRDGPTT